MIWFYGITTIINQTILLRELANLFQSNELILSILFFSWFIGTSLGSSFFRYIPDSLKMTGRYTSTLILALNVLLLVLIVSIRFLYSCFQYQSVPNLFYLSALFFIFSFPVSFLTGAGLASLLKDYAKPLSYIYFIEGIAAFLGGVAFTFLIAGRIDAIIVVSFFIFVSALFFIKGSYINITVKVFVLALSCFVMLCSSYIVKFSRDLEWRQNEKLLASSESKYGYIAEVENKGLKTTYYNGMVLSSWGTQTLYEEGAILPFLVSGNPRTICIIGFAPPGFLEEIMRCRPDEITVLLTDEILSGMLRDAVKGRDISLKIIVNDPLSSLYEIKEKYDLIFVNISLPTSIGNDVYYSDFFYKRLSRLLAPGGIVALNIPYEENNLTSYSLKNLKIIMSTLCSEFPFVEIAPAESFHLFASDSEFPPLLESILHNLAESNLDLKYLNSAFVKHYFNEERVSEYSRLIENRDNLEGNKLFTLKIYNSTLKKWLMNNLNDSWVILVLLTFGCLYLVKRYFKVISSHLLFSGTSLSMFFIGLVSIAGEIMLLNYYQIVSGYLYYLYGLLTALFMLGLGLGGFLRYSYKSRTNGRFQWSFLLLLLWLMGIEILYLATKFEFLEKLFLINILVFVWNFFGGVSLGALFNSFSRRREISGISGEVTVPELYSSDLMGSALGALITGTLLLPLLGHTITMAFICLLLLMVMAYGKK